MCHKSKLTKNIFYDISNFYSLLRKSLCKNIISDNVRKRTLHCLFLTCIQCRRFHTTPQYLAKTKKVIFPSFRLTTYFNLYIYIVLILLMLYLLC